MLWNWRLYAYMYVHMSVSGRHVWWCRLSLVFWGIHNSYSMTGSNEAMLFVEVSSLYTAFCRLWTFQSCDKRRCRVFRWFYVWRRQHNPHRWHVSMIWTVREKYFFNSSLSCLVEKQIRMPLSSGLFLLDTWESLHVVNARCFIIVKLSY